MKSLQEIYDATEEVTPRISDLTLFCLFSDSEPIGFAEAAQDKRWKDAMNEKKGGRMQ